MIVTEDPDVLLRADMARAVQVGSLSQPKISGPQLHFYVFYVSFFVNNHQTPHWGNTFLFRYSQQLLRLRLGPLRAF